METSESGRLPKKNGEYVGVGGFVLEMVKIIFFAFLIVAPIRIFIFQPFFVKGASMEPNFQDGQYLIVNEFGYKTTTVGLDSIEFFSVNPFREIKRQEAVVFRFPKDHDQYFIKRVIALPGEKIEIKEGSFKIYNQENPDGFVLDERAYLAPGLRTNGDLVMTLGENEYFVMGDNRPYSSDSRAWGPVPGDQIIGRVLLRAWPLDNISLY